MAILAEITSDDVLETAYDWLCRRRRDYPAAADVWSFRQAWAQEKNTLKTMLASGRYRFNRDSLAQACDGSPRLIAGPAQSISGTRGGAGSWAGGADHVSGTLLAFRAF